MYSSPDEARSDLFLAAAAFLFGPLLLGVLFDVVPLPDLFVVYVVLNVALPLAITILVPWLLIRYRRESLRTYGFGGLRPADLGVGALMAAPFAVVSVLVAEAQFGMNLFDYTTSGGWPTVLARIAHAVGRALLALYVTVKARDAFRQDYLTVREGLHLIGRWVLIVITGALVLLVLGNVVRGFGSAIIVLLLLPAAMAGAFAIAWWLLRGPTVTSRQVLLTPTILLALGPFALSLSGERLLASLWQAGMAAGVGLLVGVLVESKRSAWAPVGLGLVAALFTVFTLA